jgi:hemerythrin
MPVAFPEELAIGIQAVDDDHRALYGAINRLHAAMREYDLSEVSRLADYLLIYSTEHFAREERLMIEAGYPGFPEHLARHGEFVKDLRRWGERIAGQGPTPAIVVDLSQWITGWLGDHIRKVDGQMARFLRARLTPPG